MAPPSLLLSGEGGAYSRQLAQAGASRGAAAAPGGMWGQLAAAGGGGQVAPPGQLAGAGGGAFFGASNAFAPPQQQQQQQQGAYLSALTQQPLLAAGHGNALGYGSSAPVQALQQAGYAGLSTAELQQRLAFLNASRGGSTPDRGLWAGALPGQAASMQLPPVLQQQQPQQVMQQAGGAGAGGAGWSWLDAFEARQKALAAEKAAGVSRVAGCSPLAARGGAHLPLGQCTHPDAPCATHGATAPPARALLWAAVLGMPARRCFACVQSLTLRAGCSGQCGGVPLPRGGRRHREAVLWHQRHLWHLSTQPWGRPADTHPSATRGGALPRLPVIVVCVDVLWPHRLYAASRAAWELWAGLLQRDGVHKPFDAVTWACSAIQGMG